MCYINRHVKCNAGVSELADETDSKSVIRKGVWVQVPPPAPRRSKVRFAPTYFLQKISRPPALLLLNVVIRD